MDKRFIDAFSLYKNDVFRLAYSYVKNQADAEDIAQKVFIKLYKNYAELEDNKHIKKWCFKVTVNECKDLSLSAWKRKIFPITREVENDSGVKIQNKENNILEAIKMLPQKYCSTIYLYYYEEYKISEIAEILNISETAVQTRLARAREKLKIILKGDNY